MPEYTLSHHDDAPAERARLAMIQEYQDEPTRRHLAALGVTDGWVCLDAGAGGGSIARWLAEQVGPRGSVLATDLEVGSIEAVGNLDVRQHDIRVDPLPQAAFDLVHTRLLLLHLPERDAVTGRLAAALKPGGLMVVGDIDFTTIATAEPSTEFTEVLVAFDEAVRKAGWDPETGPQLPVLLERHGLHRVEGECWRSYQRGGSPMPSIFASTLSRLRPLILGTGLDERTLDAALERLRDPRLGLHGPTVWTAWGWR